MWPSRKRAPKAPAPAPAPEPASSSAAAAAPAPEPASSSAAAAAPVPTPAPAPAPAPAARAEQVHTSGTSDPVFGRHPPLPSGRALQEFRIASHVVSVSDLKRVDVRKFILWRIQEATFRFELRQLDIYVHKSMNLWNRVIASQRAVLWPLCWGYGTESFVPRGDVESLLTRENPLERFHGLTVLSRIVHSWPRHEKYPSIDELTRRPEGMKEDDIPAVERQLWLLYAQTHYDYFGIFPTLPAKMPPNPFAGQPPSAPVASSPSA